MVGMTHNEAINTLGHYKSMHISDCTEEKKLEHTCNVKDDTKIHFWTEALLEQLWPD